jgi:hypothetical protein
VIRNADQEGSVMQVSTSRVSTVLGFQDTAPGTFDATASAASVGDVELRRCVLVRLSQLGPRISRRVRVSVRQGRVRLSGTVSSDYERQFVRQLISRVSGIDGLDESLQVQDLEPTMQCSHRARVRRGIAGRPQRTRRMIWTTAAILLAAVTCTAAPWSLLGDRLVPVRATLHVAGHPAAGAVVTLHPLNRIGSDPVLPRGRVAGNGQIEWTTYEPGDGVPPGRYVVTAVWNGPGGAASATPVLLDGVYSRPELSSLRASISPGMTDPLCWSLP